MNPKELWDKLRTKKSIFSYMEWAEDVIQQVQEENPNADLDRAFMACMPSDIMMRATEDIYKAHCRQLCLRLVTDSEPDLTLPTEAELLWLYVEQSLRGPLNQRGFACYCTLFFACGFTFPRGERLEWRESWPGQVNEDLSAIAKRNIQPNRRLL